MPEQIQGWLSFTASKKDLSFLSEEESISDIPWEVFCGEDKLPQNFIYDFKLCRAKSPSTCFCYRINCLREDVVNLLEKHTDVIELVVTRSIKELM